MKIILFTILLLCYTLVSVSQNTSDSIKLLPVNIHQTELINVFYDNYNNKFVIENNTLQNQIFTFGIFNITGTCIKEIQCETNNLRNVEIPIELYSGMYIINISNKFIKYTKKFIVR